MQNYKTQKKKSFWGRLINKSIIASLLTLLSVRFNYFLSESFVARIFYISDKADSLKENGMFGTTYSKLDKSPVFPTLRRMFAKSVESSRFVGAYRTFVNNVITASVRSTGVFFLSGGLYSLLGYIMKRVQGSADYRTYYETVAIALMIVAGAVLLFSQKSNGKKLCESLFFSSVLFDFLGLNRLAVDNRSKSENRFLTSFFGGLVFGILSFIFSIITALNILVTLIAFLIIIYSPESGLLLAMILMPVSTRTVMIPILLASLVSYILKLMRGKRNLRFKVEDVAFLFVSVISVIFFPCESKTVILLMLTVYFMTSNLMRSTEYLKKSTNALSLGLSLNVIFGSLTGIISLFGKLPSSLSFAAAFEKAGEQGFISAVALVFSLYLLAEKNSIFPFVYRLLFLASSVVSVFLSLSETVWIIAISAVFIYAIYRTLKLFNISFVYLLVMPLLMFVPAVASYVFEIKGFSLAAIESPGHSVIGLLFGSDFLGENMSFSLFSSFGIFGCIVFAVFLYLLFSRSVSSSRYSRNVPREFCALMTGCIFAFVMIGEHTYFGPDMLIFLVLCGLVSSTGNIVPPVSADDDYY